ncbi:MAG: putative quinol monooxygenase [Kiloniellales bacterium]|nr:putative quinol monooxygenase [Kiloniellales bacterium]
MSGNVYTIAVLKAKPGKADALISVLEKLAAETRKEAGAQEYGFIRDQKSPEVVLSYEKWQDAEAESAHWQTPHLAAAIERFKDLLDGEPVVHKGSKII